MKNRFNGLLFFILFSSVCVNAENKGIEILYFGARDDMALLGLGQGLEDSSKIHNGLGFRLNVESENFRPYKDPEPAVIFAAGNAETIRILSMLNPDTPVFNLIDDTEEIRALCLSNVFHILPDKTMRESVIKNWQDKVETKQKLKALAWHKGFNIGEAAEINYNFRTKRNIKLTEQGWAGWLAARLFVEAYVNEGTKSNQELIQYLKNNTNFNSGKAFNLSFRTDGQLKQSLILVAKDKALGESPSLVSEFDNRVINYCQ